MAGTDRILEDKVIQENADPVSEVRYVCRDQKPHKVCTTYHFEAGQESEEKRDNHQEMHRAVTDFGHRLLLRAACTTERRRGKQDQA